MQIILPDTVIHSICLQIHSHRSMCMNSLTIHSSIHTVLRSVLLPTAVFLLPLFLLLPNPFSFILFLCYLTVGLPQVFGLSFVCRAIMSEATKMLSVYPRESANEMFFRSTPFFRLLFAEYPICYGGTI